MSKRIDLGTMTVRPLSVTQREAGLATARKWRARATLKSFSNAIITDDKGKKSYSLSGFCHGNFGSRIAKASERMIVNGLRATTNNQKKFIEILQNDASWWGARFIENRETLVEDRFIAVSTQNSRHVTHFFNILSRLTTEHQKGLPRFISLYEKGFSLPFCAVNANSFCYAPEYVYPGGGHGSLWEARRPYQDLLNLVNGSVNNIFDPTPFRKNNLYYGTGSIFREDPNGKSNYGVHAFNVSLMKDFPDLKERLQSFRDPKASAGPVIKNPFANAGYRDSVTSRPENTNLKEWEEVFLPFFLEKGLFTRPETQPEPLVEEEMNDEPVKQ